MENLRHNFNEILAKYNASNNKNYATVAQNIYKTTLVILQDANHLIEYKVEFKDTHALPTNIYAYTLQRFLDDFVRDSITGIKLKNGYFEHFLLNLFNITPDFDVQIWPPSKIRYAYYYKNYFSDAGTLGKSCMRTKDMQRALNFYIQNNVKIVVAVSTAGKIYARALLWEDVHKSNNKSTCTYLDRIYFNSSIAYSALQKFAEDNNWEMYPSKSAGESRSYWYITDIKLDNICHLPYADTFRYLFYKDKILAAGKAPKSVKQSGKVLHLTVTANYGYFPQLDPNSVREVFTNNYISKKNAILIKKYGGYVLKKHIVDIKGSYYSCRDPEIVISNFGEYLLKENLANEVITNNTLDKTTAVYLDYYGGYVHKSNLVKINNRMYHKNDENIIEWEDKWYHISQCFSNYNREEVNKEIETQIYTKGGNPVYVFRPLHYVPYTAVISKEGLIPKEKAVIAYDIIYNSILDEVEFQEVYLADEEDTIQIATGELILARSSNRKYLKKFNGKYYLKHNFSLPDRNQMELFTE